MQSTQLTKKAFALSIVLWIVAALLFGISTLALLSKDTLFLTKGLNAKLRTQIVAEDILESLKFYVLTADYDNTSFINNSLNGYVYDFPNRLVADNRWYNIDKSIQIRVKDTSSMRNVFSISPEAIGHLFTEDNERQLRYILIDSLVDWVDKDNVVSLSGAEGSTYMLKKNVNYNIRNSNAIQDAEELRLVNGFDQLDRENWALLKKQLFYGKGNVINLMLVDKKYLKYLLNITDLEVDELIKVRKKDKIKYMTIVSSKKTFDNETMGFYLSKQLLVEIRVTVGSAKTILESIIDFRNSGDRVYRIIDYKVN